MKSSTKLSNEWYCIKERCECVLCDNHNMIIKCTIVHQLSRKLSPNVYKPAQTSMYTTMGPYNDTVRGMGAYPRDADICKQLKCNVLQSFT